MTTVKIYAAGDNTPIWTLKDGQPVIVSFAKKDQFIGNYRSKSDQDLLLKKASPSGGYVYASSSEPHWNFGKAVMLDYAVPGGRYVTTKAPENLMANGKWITGVYTKTVEDGGGGGGNNTIPTDTTTDSTTDSGSKFNMKKILPIAGAFVVFGVVIFWDKLTGKKRGKK